MRVLVACEESQRVAIAFRKRGHEAFSCDIKDCTGGHPEWHIKGDLFEVINDKWDMLIAFPPCIYICNVAQPNFNLKYGDKALFRIKEREKAIEFFLRIYNSDIPKIAIENPVGIMSRYIKPTQIIQPYQFGENYKKATCLWLKGLPPLIPLCIGNSKNYESWHDYNERYSSKSERSFYRSKTFPLIAEAMAQQWNF